MKSKNGVIKVAEKTLQHFHPYPLFPTSRISHTSFLVKRKKPFEDGNKQEHLTKTPEKCKLICEVDKSPFHVLGVKGRAQIDDQSRSQSLTQFLYEFKFSLDIRIRIGVDV
ncbi:hypothetical protein CDAR_467581 [Caerostris darwini]|uniref:Ribosomal protein S10 n=1 Tax=Caerostris darwini TaxID=1538125 RepID=A0AAV4RSQ2_9ARAC|nr:hypothetical protein CDAR_467581 [Caerostris darwini]